MTYISGNTPHAYASSANFFNKLIDCGVHLAAGGICQYPSFKLCFSQSALPTARASFAAFSNGETCKYASLPITRATRWVNDEPSFEVSL